MPLLLTYSIDPSSCAEASGWGCCQAGAAGGYHHHQHRVFLTRLEPIWGKRGVSEGVGPAASHSLCPWNKMGIYLFMPYKAMLPQSVQIIDLFRRCQNSRIQLRNEDIVWGPCYHLHYLDAPHLLCNGLWHQSVIWANSEAAGAHLAGCGPDGHEYGSDMAYVL